MKIKKILALMLAAIMLFTTFSFTTSAKTTADYEKELEEIEKELEEIANATGEAEKTLEKLKEQASVYGAQIAALDEEMAPYQKRVAELNEQIDVCEKRIAELEKEIADLNVQMEEQNKQIDETYDLLAKRVKASYMAESKSELELFLDAQNFEDYLVRSELLRQISKRDNEIIHNLETQIAALNETSQSLTEKRTENEETKLTLETTRADVEADLRVLEEKKAEKEAANSKVEANIKKQNKIIAGFEKDEAYWEKIKEKTEKEFEEFSSSLDDFVGNNGSTGNGGQVDNGSVNHKFKVSSKGFICPLQDGDVKYSATFAQHSARGTASVDIVAYKYRTVNGKKYYTSKGASIHAAASGTVIKSSYDPTSGYYIMIDHGNGITTFYCHCDKVYYGVGAKVKQGEVIAICGNTGYCLPPPTASRPASGAHLHFEMRLNGSRVNPEKYLPSPLTY